MAAPQRLDRHVQHGQVVGHEEGVEPAALQGRDEALHVGEVEVGVGIGARVAPGAGVDGRRTHEGAEPEDSWLGQREAPKGKGSLSGHTGRALVGDFLGQGRVIEQADQ